MSIGDDMWLFAMCLEKSNKKLAKRLFKELTSKLNECDAKVTLNSNLFYEKITIECNEIYKNSVEYYISEQILNVVCIDFKKKYFTERLSSQFEDLLIILIEALVEYDKEADFYLLSKSINLGSQIYLESFFAFNLCNLRQKWDNMINITNTNNLFFSSRESTIEYIKFLIDNNDIESESVSIVSKAGEVKLFDYNFKQIKTDKIFLVSNIITKSPKKINCYLDNECVSEEVSLIFKLFGNRINTYPIESLT